jgi:Gpi18-like mannosyltransferase
MKKRWATIIWIALLIKIIYFGFAVILEKTGENGVAPISFKAFTRIFEKNDSGWYLNIAQSWYPKVTSRIELGYSHDSVYRQSPWAFFPAYPLLLRMTHLSTGMNVHLAGFYWAIIFSLLSFLLFYQLCREFGVEEKESFYLTLVMMVFPFHYYFSVLYTEGLFFTFLAFGFLSLKYNKYFLFSLITMFLVMTRPNGLFMMIPLGLYYLENKGILEGYKFRVTKIDRIAIIQSLSFLPGFLTFFAYCLYQKQMTNEYFAFSIAQVGWYRRFMFPLLAFFRQGNFPTQFNSFYGIAAIIIAVFAWKRFPLSLNMLIWISLILPLCSGSVISLPRFISVIFPLTIFIGSWLYKSRGRNWILTGLFGLQMITFYFWLISDPFSY